MTTTPALFCLHELHDSGIDRVGDDAGASVPTARSLHSGGDAPVSVVARPDAPLLIRTIGQRLGSDGIELPRTRRTVALCRYGASALEPSCDGSHTLIDFRSAP